MRCKKRGPRVILTLDDRTGRIEVMLFEETFQKHRDLIAKDALVLVEGALRFDEFSDAWRLAARRISELDKVREQEARRLVLAVHARRRCRRWASGSPPSWRRGAAARARSPLSTAAPQAARRAHARSASGVCAPAVNCSSSWRPWWAVARSQVLYGTPSRRLPGASFADGR